MTNETTITLGDYITAFTDELVAAGLTTEQAYQITAARLAELVAPEVLDALTEDDDAEAAEVFALAA